MTNVENVIKNLNTIAACCKLFTNIKTCSGIDEEMYADWANTIDEAVLLLKEQNAKEQCLKTKCIICPHCDSCDVDEDGLLKEQEPHPVIFDRQCEVEPGRWERKGFCPKCHQVVLWMVNREYCGFCGQKVNWND